MILKKHSILLSFFILLICISCKHDNLSKKNIYKNEIIDSTITAFQKELLKVQIDSVFKKYDFNGSVAVFKDSVQLYRKENGFIDFKNKTKINNNSVFAIASVSKQFTAALILLLEEQGKLNVEDKISKYLSEFQNKDYENISIHQLLNHTSGLNNIGEKLLFESGSDFYYSNDGYNTLGKIIEKISGKSYDENAMELFKKIGMRHSYTGKNFMGNDFAGTFVGRNKNAKKIKNMPERLANKGIGIPAGGILSTIDDLHIWNSAFYGGKVLQSETLKKFTTKTSERNHPVFGKIGYGYGIMMNLGKPTIFFHSGYVKGSPSLNIYYPETKTSVIILSNIADELSGLETVFKPHKEIKKIVDIIENTINNMRSNEKNSIKKM